MFIDGVPARSGLSIEKSISRTCVSLKTFIADIVDSFQGIFNSPVNKTISKGSAALAHKVPSFREFLIKIMGVFLCRRWRQVLTCRGNGRRTAISKPFSSIRGFSQAPKAYSDRLPRAGVLGKLCVSRNANNSARSNQKRTNLVGYLAVSELCNNSKALCQ